MRDDDIRDFVCGVSDLDERLRREAAKAPHKDGLGTFVMKDGDRVTGYYHERRIAAFCTVPGGSEPDPSIPAIPLVLLVRFAVDRRWQARGISGPLLRDALLRAATAVARGVVGHTLSARVKPFYLRHGFHSQPDIVDPLGIILATDEIKRAAAGRAEAAF